MQPSERALPGGARRIARSAAQWLDEEGGFRTLAAQASRLLQIAHTLKRVHPRLPVSVLGLDQGTLRLACRNASEASRMRQIEPRLVAQLRQHGVAVERLRIQTQRAEATSAAAARARRAELRGPIPDSALADLGAVAGALGEGRLGSALNALVNRHRRGRHAA
jgi:hypothetical protein